MIELVSLGCLVGAYEVLEYIGARRTRAITKEIKEDDNLKQKVKDLYDDGMCLSPTIKGYGLPYGPFTYFARKELREELGIKC